MMMLLFVLISLCVGLGVSGSGIYENYHVLNVQLTEPRHVEVAKRLAESPNVIFEEKNIFSRTDYTLAVSPSGLHDIISALQNSDIHYGVVNSNLQSLFDEERERIQKNRAENLDFDFDEFNTLDDIFAQLEVWQESCPAGFICTIADYGATYEGRSMRYLRIVSDDGVVRPAYWIQATTHAREWLAPATLMKMMERFWTSYGSDPDVTHMLDTYDWYFSPVVNPDGYDYTFTDDRLWRKNRAPADEEECPGDLGIDLNRNYATESWGTDGVSGNCRSDLYPGTAPGSELETQAVQAQIHAIQSYTEVYGFWDMHTFAQYWLFPFGHTIEGNEDPAGCARADTHDAMMVVADAIADATENTHGTSWERGTICEVLYPMSGSAVDYVYSEADVPYAFLPELRGAWFTIDPDQIQPSYEEIWNGLVAMVNTIEEIGTQ